MKLQNWLALFICFVSNISAITCCLDNERAALLSFKSQLADPSNRLSSWNGRNCCTWHGIRCSNMLHVVSVDLRNPNPTSFILTMNSELVSSSNSTSSALIGSISSSLFTLAHIRHLDLSFNNFQFSRIPTRIANLTHLTYLNLSNSMFSDSITTQLANLTSLRWLDLSCSLQVTDFSSISYNLSSQLTVRAGVEYTYIPGGYLSSSNLDWLKGLRNLRGLFLRGVDLSEASKFPQWANPLSDLFNLRSLWLSNYKIMGKVPVNQLLNLTQMYVLAMDFNSFTSQIPVRLANMTSLLALVLTGSNLKGTIPYLPQLQELHVDNTNLTIDLESMFAVPWPRLKFLDIRSSQVIGSIPPSFANTTSLVTFIAYNCFIEGNIPSSMTNLSRLERLHLELNRLVGQIPASISNLKSLAYLSLIQNSLEGKIPDSICNISSLQYLALSSNNLSGKLPDCITHFPKLQVLHLSLNSFTGTIPSLTSFFKSSNPYIVGLGYNKLTVKLDQQLFPPSFQPQVLDLSSCNISGEIPDFLSNQTQLAFLSLAYNNLSGSIPSWLFHLPNLGCLDLSFNRLQGFLPPTIQMNLFFGPTILNLAGNLLEGLIPSLLANIDAINLSGNNFTGYIPPQIGLGNARYISLSGTKLTGQIPVSFCQENNALMLLDLSNNSVSGSLPGSLGNCTSLSFLNIAHNNLSSSIPAVVGNAKSLSNLDLTGNHFEGPFPNFIQKLQNLVVLKMGYNNFAGKIPHFIGDLKNLRILVLKSNFFNESIPPDINKIEKLQIMDFSDNKLSGTIPEKLDGLKTLITRPMDGDLLGYVFSAMYAGVELSMGYKGLIYKFDVVRTYHSGIDISLNALTGNIPQEMTLLKGLAMLNLSHNALSGEIPSGIGDMSGLQSLDLSFNKLTAGIPETINLLDSLGIMNLSYNNLSGRIPPGTKFDTLSEDGWTYVGNEFLCGSPHAKTECKINDGSSDQEPVSEDDTSEKWLLIGIVAAGYVVGFSGYFVVLNLLKERWRERYWMAIDKLASRISVSR